MCYLLRLGGYVVLQVPEKGRVEGVLYYFPYNMVRHGLAHIFTTFLSFVTFFKLFPLTHLMYPVIKTELKCNPLVASTLLIDFICQFSHQEC